MAIQGGPKRVKVALWRPFGGSRRPKVVQDGPRQVKASEGGPRRVKASQGGLKRVRRFKVT